MLSIARDLSPEQLAGQVAALARRSLVAEPSLWPRFGLVGPESPGGHHDMNYGHLVVSACVLEPFFAKVVGGVLERGSIDFEALRYHGRVAEARMLEATDGVNTHKGALFLLALLLAGWARGWCASGRAVPLPAVLTAARRAAAVGLRRDLATSRRGFSETYGEWAHRRFGWRGIRGLVLDGFQPLGRAFGPRYRKLPRPLAKAHWRLLFLAESEDTNLLKRAGRTRALALRGRARRLLSANSRDPETWRRVQRLEAFMESRRLSAAAAGDLVAAALLFERLENHGYLC